MAVAIAEKIEINWGILLDRNNGATKFKGVDCVVLHYTQPIEAQNSPVQVSALILSGEKLTEDLSAISVRTRRDRLSTLHRGRQILQDKFLARFGPRMYAELEYTGSIGVISQLIEGLSLNQRIAKQTARYNPTEEPHRRRLVRACR